MIIYKATNSVNGKIYIGQTRQKLTIRKHQHKHCHKTAISHAIKKYGLSAFEFIEIEQCYDDDELNRRESFWIEHFNCIAPNGYNLVGGGYFKVMSEETRNKIRLRNTGKTRSDETKKRISESKKGFKHTEEFKQNRSKEMKEKFANNIHHMVGKTLSEEWKQAISDGHKKSGKMKGNHNGRSRKGFKCSEETNEKNRQARVALWQNEEYRNKCIAAGKTRPPQTIETKLKRSESIKKTLALKKERCLCVQ